MYPNRSTTLLGYPDVTGRLRGRVHETVTLDNKDKNKEVDRRPFLCSPPWKGHKGPSTTATNDLLLESWTPPPRPDSSGPTPLEGVSRHPLPWDVRLQSGPETKRWRTPVESVELPSQRVVSVRPSVETSGRYRSPVFRH